MLLGKIEKPKKIYLIKLDSENAGRYTCSEQTTAQPSFAQQDMTNTCINSQSAHYKRCLYASRCFQITWVGLPSNRLCILFYKGWLKTNMIYPERNSQALVNANNVKYFSFCNTNVNITKKWKRWVLKHGTASNAKKAGTQRIPEPETESVS